MKKMTNLLGFYITTALICPQLILCDNAQIHYPPTQFDGSNLPLYPSYNQYANNRNSADQSGSAGQERQNLATVPHSYYPQASNNLDELDYNNVVTFGWRLFKAVKPSNLNYIISPMSPQFLLSQLITAAEGNTKNELINTIGYNNSDDLNTLANAINQRNSLSKNKIEVASAIFTASNLAINETFSSNLQNSRAQLARVNFKNPKSTARIINTWVSEATRGNINTILDPNGDFEGTMMMFLNAIYFRGTWAYEFNATKDRYFSSGNGGRQLVKFMEQTKKYRYGELNNARYVEIPYDKSEFSMVIMVPKQKYQLNEMIEEMTPKDLDDLIEELFEENRSNVHLEIPKFSIKSSVSLVQPLANLGLRDIFTSQANLPYVATNAKAQVNNIIHQAVINVDEIGTVASAATVVSVITLSITLPVNDVHMVVDEPFLAVIVDKHNKIPIFIAQVYEP